MLKRESPIYVNPEDGCDVALKEGKEDVWIAVGDIHVCVIRRDEGVAVELHAGRCLDDEPLAETWALFSEARCEEDDEQDRCRTEGCDGDPNDGEGWDGYCGNCADHRERYRECRECYGTGRLVVPFSGGVEAACTHCDGTGEVEREEG